jgi:hypothetical protein
VKSGLLVAAAAGVILNIALGVRDIAGRLGVVAPRLDGALLGDEAADGGGFARRLLAPTLPLDVFIVVVLAVLVRAESYSAIATGLALAAIGAVVVIPALGGELVLWSHEAERASHEDEAALLPRLQRVGIHADEIWFCRTPIVTFWRPQLLTPSLVVGRRVLLWEKLRGVPVPRAAGIALGPVARFWPWALWPLGIGALFRASDPSSALPWWIFGSVAGLITLAAAPDLLRMYFVNAAMRTDAAAREAIRGRLDVGAIEVALVAARGSGWFTHAGTRLTWAGAVTRARRAGRRAGLDDKVIDAMANEVLGQG